MLISHTHKFIFNHMYKTAGTSVMDVFSPCARLPDRMAYDFKSSINLYARINKFFGWPDDGMLRYTGHRKHAKEIDIINKLDPGVCDSYYKFTFVRNPFDFLVNLYFYILQANYHPMHKLVFQSL